MHSRSSLDIADTLIPYDKISQQVTAYIQTSDFIENFDKNVSDNNSDIVNKTNSQI